MFCSKVNVKILLREPLYRTIVTYFWGDVHYYLAKIAIITNF